MSLPRWSFFLRQHFVEVMPQFEDVWRIRKCYVNQIHSPSPLLRGLKIEDVAASYGHQRRENLEFQFAFLFAALPKEGNERSKTSSQEWAHYSGDEVPPIFF